MCGECGKKTGYLITADGSEKEKIQPEGLKEYQVRPPMTIEPAHTSLIWNSVGPMDEENETTVIEDDVQQGKDLRTI